MVCESVGLTVVSMECCEAATLVARWAAVLDNTEAVLTVVRMAAK